MTSWTHLHLLMFLLRLRTLVGITPSLILLIEADGNLCEAVLEVLPFHPEDAIVLDANLVPGGLQRLRVFVPCLRIIIMPLALPLVGHVRISHMHQLQGDALAIPGNRYVHETQDGVSMSCQDALIFATTSAGNAVALRIPGLQLVPNLGVCQGCQVVTEGGGILAPVAPLSIHSFQAHVHGRVRQVILVGASDDPIWLMPRCIEADSDADSRFSCQHLQSNSFKAAIQAVVGLNQLCAGLLQEAWPEFVLLSGLGKARSAIRTRPLPVRNAIVDGDHLPFFGMRAVEPNVIAAILRQLVLLEESSHAVRVLCES
mmetsp:Transcript_5969/g.7394  ORF Transcript_5969/g.7394 Transcript_5969/m.7394 type:complete len:315 (-) Transcript_5969:493-1437(-)